MRWTAGPDVVRPPEPPGDRDALPESGLGALGRAAGAGRFTEPSAGVPGITATRRTSGISRAAAARPVSEGVTTGAAPGSTARWTAGGDEESTAGESADVMPRVRRASAERLAPAVLSSPERAITGPDPEPAPAEPDEAEPVGVGPDEPEPEPGEPDAAEPEPDV
ncbi:hypothetical protein [Streptomyces sp. GESEQ-35]|uniref:hypothetical protein n=1 Tax=Streptomyces sp. GESEQ-35 TaxID=2812657 RepID=UPI001B33420A|nr:hypothetical protein [Streptomyces sp. GESEQ-35]